MPQFQSLLRKPKSTVNKRNQLSRTTLTELINSNRATAKRILSGKRPDI
jgi:hypothetical protein